MAIDIIILNIAEGQAGMSSVNCLFWFQADKGAPSPAFISAYRQIDSDPKTVGLRAELQKGTVIEENHSYEFPADLVIGSFDMVQGLILAFYNARKQYRSLTLPESGLKYALMYDSDTGWLA